MGGMHGFGPIEYEKDEPVFHHKWEGRVYAMWVPFAGNLRFTIESMPPTEYLRSSYYERWLYAKTQDALDQGFFTQEELDTRIAYFRANPQAEPPRRDNPEAAARSVAENCAAYSHRKETGVPPAFRVGDSVCIKNIHPAGHTRLPRYVRGKRAMIINYYGVQDFDDGLPGEIQAPQPLYCVRFEGQELWGESAEANNALYLDIWESYLEPLPKMPERAPERAPQ